MEQNKILLGGVAVLLLVAYNGAQPGLRDMRTMRPLLPETASSDKKQLKEINNIIRKQRYGPSMEWLDRVMKASESSAEEQSSNPNATPKLDFQMMSSMMLAGLASGFKSQVANLLWMKSDEYWHKGMLTRQNPIMEAVVTLDPQFIEAWDTAGWHWAYNIYADLPNRPDLVMDEKMSFKERERRNQALRMQQDNAIKVGLNYYARGTEMNPDKYLLWFKYGWTRAEKFGLMDEKTIELYQEAREQPDARLQEITKPGKDGKPTTEQVEGLDLMGRTIGHAYERMPNFTKAVSTYGEILGFDKYPERRQLLVDNGRYWARYSSLYGDIIKIYNEGDADTKATIKRLVPDFDRLNKAFEERNASAAFNSGQGSQPTGAIVSIAARYLPAWELLEQGKLDEAARQIVGVMNADPKYHLQGLPVMQKIWALRGDSPSGIETITREQKGYEKESSQEIGLHLLARIFEAKLARETDPQRKKALAYLAYESWYRARERDTLNFQARRATLNYEDQYNFPVPQYVIDQVTKSRRAATGVIAAPDHVPTIEEAQKHLTNPVAASPTPTPTPALDEHGHPPGHQH